MTDGAAPQHGQASSSLTRRLRVLGELFPELREAAETYGAILSVLRDAPAFGGPAAVSAGEAERKIARGEPLLSDVPLVFDVVIARIVVLRLAEALEAAGRAAASPVRQALERRRIPLEPLLRHAVAGEASVAETAARRAGVDPVFLDVVVRNALKPALRAWNRQLGPLARGLPWEKAYCFVCGAPAALAELRGNALLRAFRCGRCGAEWGVRRILCASCGNEDPQTLGFLEAEEGPEGARAAVCDGCGVYVKTIAVFEPCTADGVVVEDLATLPLDCAARALGYRPCAPRLPGRSAAAVRMGMEGMSPPGGVDIPSFRPPGGGSGHPGAGCSG